MKKSIFLKLFLIISIKIWSQPHYDQITISTGKDRIPVNQPLEITVTVYNASERPVVLFPEIKDFVKGSMSTTTKTLNEEGQRRMVQIITQQYFVSNPGSYLISPFQVIVNKNRIRNDGFTVVFESNEKDTTAIYQEDGGFTATEMIGNDAFLSIKSNKASVYVGEGFSVRLSLFIAKNAPLDMEFYKLDSQLELILKSIRSPTCWEENLGISEITQRDVLVNNRKFTEFLIYQAVFYPITPQQISIPAVSLQMVINETDKDQHNVKKTYRSFSSKPIRIQVTPLPPHPLKDQVAVGTFRLVESSNKKNLASGESFRYVFQIVGTGNISAIMAPILPQNSSFDFYQPDINQTIQRDLKGVSGEKTFDYFIVARQQGQYPWGSFFQWIYFDPEKSSYDTLRSREMISVSGENLKDDKDRAMIDSPNLFSNIDQLDTAKLFFDYQSLAKNIILTIIAIMLLAMVWIFNK